MLKLTIILLIVFLSNEQINFVKSTFGGFRRLVFPKYVEELSQIQDMVKFIEYFGYKGEKYDVETSDGYILEMHRIPRKGARPVLIMHGLTSSSAGWLMVGSNQPGLPYLLHDNDYDVWVGNVRGNPYGKRHTKFNPSWDGGFWNFSWHELGLYDLPAMVDFVLEKTNRKKLSYVGHSQGCTMFLVMTSMLPEYNDKIDIMHAFSPAAFRDKSSRSYQQFSSILGSFRQPLIGEFDPQTFPIRQICLQNRVNLNFCIYFTSQIVGPDAQKINMTLLPVFLRHYPVGTSLKTLGHFYQIYQSGNFETYDENLFSGNHLPTKNYPLENIKVPIAIYYAELDVLVSPRDISLLKRKLPNVVLDYLVPNKRWNHLDFVIAPDAGKVLYPKVLEIQKKYEQKEDDEEEEEEDDKDEDEDED